MTSIADKRGIKTIPAPRYQDDPQVRIALALETLAGCTGWVDPATGMRQHDGDTCPIHEGQDDPLDAPPEDWWLTRVRDWVWRNAGL